MLVEPEEGLKLAHQPPHDTSINNSTEIRDSLKIELASDLD